MKNTDTKTNPEKPDTGVPPQAPGYAEIVGEALDFVWNDWCGDTGTIPGCFCIHGPRTTRVEAYFTGSRFAELVAERIKARLAEGESHNAERSGRATQEDGGVK